MWRETLLAKHVLEGKTKGYRNHPQLQRFKNGPKPLDHINQYLATVFEEATARGYNFDRGKIDWKFKKSKLKLTRGQFEYEIKHLMAKLISRDPVKYQENKKQKQLEPHPLFEITEGGIEDWEIIR